MSISAVFSRVALCAAVFFFIPLSSAFAWKPTAPASALFYPDEVAVTVEDRAAPEALPFGGKGFIIPVPSSVKQNTFLLSIGDVPAGGWFWLTPEQRDTLLAEKGKPRFWGKAALPENEPDPERKTLLHALAEHEEELARINGEITGVDARLALLKKTLDTYGQNGVPPTAADAKKSVSAAEEAARLDAAYAKNYPALFKERDRLERMRKDMTELRREAEKRLEDYDRREGVEFVAVPFDGAGAKFALRYSYVLPARTELSYRLNALPDKGQVVLSQDVALTQWSGLTWAETQVHVSTMRRDTTLMPGFLRPWIISLINKAPAPNAMPAMAEAPRQKTLLRQELADSAVAEYAPALPVFEEFSSFRVWNVGPRQLNSSSPLRLLLNEQILPASFFYTLRPSLSPRGFLTARLDLEEALELPPGMTQFSVDGGSVARQGFTFNGTRGEIFFGSDPRVTAVMRDMNNSSGEQGFFNKDATHDRRWQISVYNSRQRVIEAVVEDSAPDGRDNSIVIKTTSSPKPELVVMEPKKGGAKVLRWRFDVEPGTPMVIDHAVEIAAPIDKDKELHTGR